MDNLECKWILRVTKTQNTQNYFPIIYGQLFKFEGVKCPLVKSENLLYTFSNMICAIVKIFREKFMYSYISTWKHISKRYLISEYTCIYIIYFYDYLTLLHNIYTFMLNGINSKMICFMCVHLLEITMFKLWIFSHVWL
jgi:hypothetical protein